ncbi:hypothetical protein A8B84_16895 [Marinobacter sp. EhC06]|uniref:hypothetical protein n=1 Tax=Marinobacter TaxID=2742 RepID=UPI0007D9A339|nr:MULTISPECIES: hypothetical protein [unclassified Marinobacter]OAN92790.1 hypothetical protein A8B80_18065 [Marinobacter sp. EhN04]OAN96315.1 hypothetical protein A8B84_16895 [Marinobacter sp. EhC06]
MNGSTQLSQGNYLPTEGMKGLLRRWFYLKFVQKKSTVELMATASDLRNKSALSIVALLDVDEQMISQVVGKKRLIFVQNCHAYLKGPGK